MIGKSLWSFSDFSRARTDTRCNAQHMGLSERAELMDTGIQSERLYEQPLFPLHLTEDGPVQ